ncbi:hypothetical protein [Bradyrhizobium sp. dw_411]|uniref:hypothetical protein n=1 Tax=Bradyrhizobium sp. dw_411 TaxID=2720082 RepID=UPI001BCDB291|nr:hypothetical protein [Bradyrhizobium sp. dw_411]
MTDARLMAELAKSCRLLACHQQNPNILDMLHDFEEDFAQKARDIESGKRRARHDEPLSQQSGPLRVSSGPWFS